MLAGGASGSVGTRIFQQHLHKAVSLLVQWHPAVMTELLIGDPTYCYKQKEAPGA